jgi:glycosyltransferase involved in cell wall biosynthesis
LEHELENILFLPFQRFEIFSKVLSSSDCNIVMLEDDSSEFCVPSKFLSILCSKRIPIVYVKDNNLIVRIIKEYHCGIHVKNQTELNQAIEDIYLKKINTELLSSNARNYAEKYFNIEKIYEDFSTIILN